MKKKEKDTHKEGGREREKNATKNSAAEGTGRAKGIRTESGACAELKAVTRKCQTRHSAERIREIEATDVYKGCPYAVKRTLTYHRIFYFVIS